MSTIHPYLLTELLKDDNALSGWAAGQIVSAINDNQSSSRSNRADLDEAHRRAQSAHDDAMDLIKRYDWLNLQFRNSQFALGQANEQIASMQNKHKSDAQINEELRKYAEDLRIKYNQLVEKSNKLLEEVSALKVQSEDKSKTIRRLVDNEEDCFLKIGEKNFLIDVLKKKHLELIESIKVIADRYQDNKDLNEIVRSFNYDDYLSAVRDETDRAILEAEGTRNFAANVGRREMERIWDEKEKAAAK